MKDNVTEAGTSVSKGKAKFTMVTKKDNVSKVRNCVTEGISIGKNQTNSSSFKGKNDFSKAIGKENELSVNPSSQDVPRKSCELNLPDSEDELMQQAVELFGEFHNYEPCCKSRKKRMHGSLIISERESSSPPPLQSVATKKDDVTRARTCVTKGISVGKIQSNSSSFKGKNDFSEAIGEGKEFSVNPSSRDVPKKICESNIPESEDEVVQQAMELDIPKKSCESNIHDSEDEVMQQAMEFLGEFHNHELCCKNRKRRMEESLLIINYITERESPSPPPPESVILEQKEELRKLYQVLRGEKIPSTL
ncbi:uncharacterized protein LOC111399120 isoform X1 [Olea europaea var. sylvestris]|uniref:uncharacterized protein LOC111399120 isoform X1 n=1 Tax=Olea europaea var. sylvestris TaxID=158386 RepID=UPI000C1D07BA|nr:uncharacterized protein LOC111399120 isoform X1 [Olea europaea var. sylvestris]